MTTPAMSFPITANPSPAKLDVGTLGPIYVTGALSGIGFTQNHLFPGDVANRSDVSNAQVFIQKTDGTVQYFVQGGEYSMLALGAGYLRADATPNATYGPLPQVFIKFVPNDKLSFQFGKLPTLIGDEYTFSFENANIERGLLWNQENAVNRGVQANYTSGPITASLAWSDGFYSKRYNWLSFLLADTIDPSNSVSFVAGGSTKRTTVSSFATPTLLNNEEIANLIYTHTTGPWTVSPYVQYTKVPASTVIGTMKSATTFGAAVLANYAFDAKSELAGWNLAGRVEWIGSSGSATDGSPNLLYGPGSKAWSFTITPTYQYKVFFARAEFSYVKATSLISGWGFGAHGTDDSQMRVVAEAGIVF